MDEQVFDRIGSALEGISTHTASGSITGGSFSYSPDQLRDLVTEYVGLADTYVESLDHAHRMASVEGPGLEYASQSHAAVARESGQAYRQSIENERRSCLAMAQLYQDTLHDYLGLERRNVETMKQAGPLDEQAGPRGGI